jgi:hypothetical protein
MAYLYLVPPWFFGIDIVFELVFAIVTLVVGLYSFKVYKLSGQNSSRLFGLAFLFFSISYFIQSFLNLAILSKLAEDICVAIKLSPIATLSIIGINIHIIFFIVGLVLLTYMTLRINSYRTSLLLLVICLASVLIAHDSVYWFYSLSSILLVFIVSYYYSNYMNNHGISCLFVFIAFLFLFVANVHFIFASSYAIFYAIGHFLELIAYVLILINLIIILRK